MNESRQLRTARQSEQSRLGGPTRVQSAHTRGTDCSRQDSNPRIDFAPTFSPESALGVESVGPQLASTGETAVWAASCTGAGAMRAEPPERPGLRHPDQPRRPQGLLEGSSATCSTYLPRSGFASKFSLCVCNTSSKLTSGSSPTRKNVRDRRHLWTSFQRRG